MKRRPLLGAHLGEKQRARGEVERRVAIFSRHGGAALLPVKAPGDHQMKHQEEIVFELEDDAFADTVEAENFLPLGSADRRIERAQQKRARQADFLKRLVEQPRFEGFDVDGDVGQLRHVLRKGPRIEDREWRMASRVRRSSILYPPSSIFFAYSALLYEKCSSG